MQSLLPTRRMYRLLSLLVAGLIDYNFHCFRKAIQEVFEVQHKMAALSKLPPDLNDTATIQSNGLVGQGHTSDVLS